MGAFTSTVNFYREDYHIVENIDGNGQNDVEYNYMFSELMKQEVRKCAMLNQMKYYFKTTDKKSVYYKHIINTKEYEIKNGSLIVNKIISNIFSNIYRSEYYNSKFYDLHLYDL